MVAIIPAAGLGKRMAAVTGGTPKELLALGSKSVLLRILEEARECEPNEIVVISSALKPEMDEAIRGWAQKELADTPIRIVHQAIANGAAPAIATAGVEDDAVILLGDCVFAPESPIVRMANLIERGIDATIAVEQVPAEMVSKYGIAEVHELTGAITRLMEKPKLEETSSRWAVAARFAISKRIMAFLAETVDQLPAGRELAIPEVLAQAIQLGADIRAVALQPNQQRLDCGDEQGYKLALRERWD